MLNKGSDYSHAAVRPSNILFVDFGKSDWPEISRLSVQSKRDLPEARLGIDSNWEVMLAIRGHTAGRQRSGIPLYMRFRSCRLH